MSAREFYDNYLLPNFLEWEQYPLDERRAMNATISANQMADWYFQHLQREGIPLNEATTPTKLRDKLASQYCADFKLVWDVADAHKHFALNRKSADVKNAIDTGVRVTSYVEKGYWAEGYVADQKVISIDLGDGKLVDLARLVRNVLVMWENLLKQHGW